MTLRFTAGGLLPPSPAAHAGTTIATPSATLRQHLAMADFLAARMAQGQAITVQPQPSRPTTPIDLRTGITSWPVRDQGRSMLCVGYAVGACIELANAWAALSPEPQPLSAGYLYWAMRQHKPSGFIENWDNGGTRFDCAVAALAEEGICPLAKCPDALGPIDPTQAAKDAAERLTCLHGAVSRVPGQPAIGDDAAYVMPHIADLAIAELQAKRPVAMGFPVYPTQGGSTNWNDAGLDDGTLNFPLPPGSHGYVGGHAVCIVGFVPDDGGYFVFRNSQGSDFGRTHAILGVTGFGYGRISVENTKMYCWDYFTLLPKVG